MSNDVLVSVVDDDESVRESLSALLCTFGFDVRSFDCAETFLVSDALTKTKCIILDVAMPGMSGPELFERLKQQFGLVSVVFITAQSSDVCERLVALGAVACLHKPFDPMALIEAVKRALELRRQL